MSSLGLNSSENVLSISIAGSIIVLDTSLLKYVFLQ